MKEEPKSLLLDFTTVTFQLYDRFFPAKNPEIVSTIGIQNLFDLPEKKYAPKSRKKDPEYIEQLSKKAVQRQGNDDKPLGSAPGRSGERNGCRLNSSPNQRLVGSPDHKN